MILAALLFSASSGNALPGVTSFARPVEISRAVPGRVVAVLADVRIDAPVEGDVLVWGGDVVFGPKGSVAGNLSVFGGEIRVPGAREIPVRGSVSTPGSLLALYLAEMHRAPWAAPARPLTFLGLRLVALAAWLAGTLVLLAFFGSPFARAAASAEHDWSGSLLAGACGVAGIFLAAAAALALLPAPVSVPLAFACGAVAVAAKVFGMGALFLLLGQKLGHNVSAARRPAALAFGFALLAGLSLVPFVGPILWSAASVVAVGIALVSRFGTPRYRIALS